MKNSPSAFIPFCEYNGDMMAVGEQDHGFPFPICNAFTPTVLHGQLCYTFDPPDNDRLASDEPFLMFLLDYNEDRQVNTLEDGEKVIKNRLQTLHELKEDNTAHDEAMIYIHTLGKMRR